MGIKTQTAWPSHYFGWGKALLILIILCWALLVSLALKKHGDVLEVISVLGPFGVGAGAIWFAQDRFEAEYGEGVIKRFWCNTLHWVHLFLIVWALSLYFPVSDERKGEKIVSQVKDSVSVQQKKMPGKAKCKGCPAIDRSRRNDQDHLIDSLLNANEKLKNELFFWKLKADSQECNSKTDAPFQ